MCSFLKPKSTKVKNRPYLTVKIAQKQQDNPKNVSQKGLQSLTDVLQHPVYNYCTKVEIITQRLLINHSIIPPVITQRQRISKISRITFQNHPCSHNNLGCYLQAAPPPCPPPFSTRSSTEARDQWPSYEEYNPRVNASQNSVPLMFRHFGDKFYIYATR